MTPPPSPSKWTAANGYGLYDPALPMARLPLADVPDITAADAGRTIFPVSREELLAYHQALVEFDRQANTLPPESLGDPDALTLVMQPPRHLEAAREWYRRLAPSPDCVILYNRLNALASYGPADRRLWPQPLRLWLEDVPWIRPFQTAFREVYDLRAANEQATRRETAGYILTVGDGAPGLHSSYIEQAIPPETRYRVLRRVALALMQVDPAGVMPEKVSADRKQRGAEGMRVYIKTRWLDELSSLAKEAGEAALRDYRQLFYVWTYHPGFHGPAQPWFGAETFVDLWRMLPERDSIRVLLDSTRAMRELTDPEEKPDQYYAGAPGLRELVRRVAERVIDVETGEAAVTPLASAARSVGRFTGAERFAAIAALLEERPAKPGADGPTARPPSAMEAKQALLNRLAHAVHDEGIGPDGRTPRVPLREETKRAVLSRLARACHPAEGEDAGVLRRCLAERGVTMAQLTEAMAFAPQWENSQRQNTRFS